MLRVLFLLIGFAEIACAGSAKNITLHKRTQYFVDIEAPTDQVWFGCVDKDIKRDIALMIFYVLDGGKSWTFHYRRILGVAQCLADEQEYRDILKGSKMIRIVGIQPMEEKGPEPEYKPIPKSFTNVKAIISATFIRLQTKEKCKAFFKHHCDLPQNYWADTIPK